MLRNKGGTKYHQVIHFRLSHQLLFLTSKALLSQEANNALFVSNRAHTFEECAGVSDFVFSGVSFFIPFSRELTLYKLHNIYLSRNVNVTFFFSSGSYSHLDI